MPGKKLLVADDSLTIQKVIRLALSNEGYEIQAVSDGNDAIQQVTLFKPDVVLIDVSLPGKSAFEVKREINQHVDLEEIRFVLMSSAFEKVDESQTEEVNFHGRLTKPFDPAHLRQVLSEVLAQVTAKRMERTSLFSAPIPEESRSAEPPSPPPLPAEPPQISENYSEWETTMAPPELPPIPSGPEPEAVQNLWDSENLPPSLPPELPLTPPPIGPQLGAEIASELQVNIPPPPSHFELPSPPSTLELPTPPPLMNIPAPPSISGMPPLVFPEPQVNPAPTTTDGPTDTDIRRLTESTMKMTGLDDFQWSVKEPSIKPLKNMLDTGETSFDLDGEIEPPSPPEFETPEFLTPSTHPPVGTLVEPPPIPSIEPQLRDTISTSQIETMIARQVEATLEKLAQKLLPELAEKVIKQEIHRILSE